MTAGSLIVLGFVALAVVGAILSLVRSHRSGRCSCGCDGCCSGCQKCKKCIETKEGTTVAVPAVRRYRPNHFHVQSFTIQFTKIL